MRLNVDVYAQPHSSYTWHLPKPTWSVPRRTMMSHYTTILECPYLPA